MHFFLPELGNMVAYISRNFVTHFYGVTHELRGATHMYMEYIFGVCNGWEHWRRTPTGESYAAALS